MVNKNVISDPQADSVLVCPREGSILGPLLLVLYINDICNCIDDDVFMNLFADDTLISVEDCDVERACQRMNETLRKLEDWLNRNKLFINCTKSKVMHFGDGWGKLLKSNLPYLNGVHLEYVDSFKYLGVVSG